MGDGPYWGRRRWAWTAAHPGTLTFRLMCRAEAAQGADQDVSVADSAEIATDESSNTSDVIDAVLAVGVENDVVSPVLL